MNVVEPSKESQPCQITLVMQGINTLGSLPDVFQTLLNYQKCDESFKQRRNMTFEFHDGQTCSILVSKDEKKIRIQTNELH